jgi:hypothetical protein
MKIFHCIEREVKINSTTKKKITNIKKDNYQIPQDCAQKKKKKLLI